MTLQNLPLNLPLISGAGTQIVLKNTPNLPLNLPLKNSNTQHSPMEACRGAS